MRLHLLEVATDSGLVLYLLVLFHRLRRLARRPPRRGWARPAIGGYQATPLKETDHE